MICLVAPIAADKAPRLISTGHNAPLKGQVLDLTFKDSVTGSVDWQVVKFDDAHSRRLQEFYHSQHGTLVRKSDWSEPVLQRFYRLDQLVALTSQDQRVLCDLLKQQPHILIFQAFKSLPRLSYSQYIAACRSFGVTEFYEAGVVADAQRHLQDLEYLYMQNAALPRGILDGVCNPAALELLARVGLSQDAAGDYCWDLTRQYETVLRERLSSFARGPVLDYTCTRTAAWPRLVLLGTAYATGDGGLETILRVASEHGAYLDFSRGYTIHAVQAKCAGAEQLCLCSVHLISIPALVGLLNALHDSLTGLTLCYDYRYASRTTRFLNDLTGVTRRAEEQPRLVGLLPLVDVFDAKTLPAGYSFQEPVSWMAPSHVGLFLQFFWTVRRDAVVLVDNAADFVWLNAKFVSEQKEHRLPGSLHSDLRQLESGEMVMMLDDLFGGVLRYERQVDARVCSATAMAEPEQPAMHYTYDSLWRMRVLYLGQCKHRPKYVFFYTTSPLTQTVVYRLLAHTGANLLLSCELALLQTG